MQQPFGGFEIENPFQGETLKKLDLPVNICKISVFFTHMHTHNIFGQNAKIRLTG